MRWARDERNIPMSTQTGEAKRKEAAYFLDTNLLSIIVRGRNILLTIKTHDEQLEVVRKKACKTGELQSFTRVVLPI